MTPLKNLGMWMEPLNWGMARKAVQEEEEEEEEGGGGGGGGEEDMHANNL
jgi:hypothetical protein